MKLRSVLLIITLFLGLLSLSLSAQETMKTSRLKNEIKKQKNKAAKIHFLDSLLVGIQSIQLKEDSTLAHFYYDLANQYDKVEKDAFALDLHRRALNIRQKIFFKNHPQIARTYWKMGQVSTSLGFVSEAIVQYQEGLKILRKNKPKKERDELLSRIFRDLGYAYTLTGDYYNAVVHSSQSSIFYGSLKDTFNLAYVLNDLAVSHYRLEQLDSSLEVLSTAENLLKKYKGTKKSTFNNVLSSVMLNKGNAFLGKSQLDQGLEYYEKALTLLDKNNKVYLICLGNIGLIYAKKGNFVKALAYHQIALKNKQAYYKTPFHFQYAPTYDNIADIHRAQGNYQAALKNYHQAIQQSIPQFRTQKDPGQNPDLHQMQILGAPADLLTYLSSKANTLQLIYLKTKAPKDLQAALDTYKTADTLVDLMRQEHTEEASKLFWRKTTRPVYEQAIETAYLAGNYADVFYFMEKSKAVLLADALNEREAKEKANLPAGVLLEIRELQKELNKVNKEEGNRSAYLSKKNELHKLISSLEKDYPAYYQFKYNRKIPDLALLRRELLDDTTAFVQYFLSDSVIYSIQISKEEVKMNRVLYTKEDLLATKKMLGWVEDPEFFTNYKESYQDTFKQINRSITRLLWKPISPKINRYIVAADSWLNYLNFELLRDKEERYLIENNTFNYVYSATVLQYVLPRKARAEKQFLGIAPVVFPYDDRLGDLMDSKKSLSNIHQYLSGECLTEDQANRQNFLDKMRKNWRILHWHSHAEAGDSTFIALADQKIYLAAIYQLPLAQTELVTLSACESHLGEEQQGEGLMSISRACIYAGAQSVVASHWKVQERPTTQLMTNFYKNLSLNLPKDQALRKAKLQMLRSGAPPANWAAFVSIGNPAAMVGLEKNGGFLKWLVLFFVIVFLATFIIMPR